MGEHATVIVELLTVTTFASAPIFELPKIPGQGLRRAFQSLQGWQSDGPPVTTECALECVDAAAPSMSLSRQHPKGHSAAGHLLLLSSVRARLTAGQAQLMFTDPDAFLDWGATRGHMASFSSRQRQAIRGVVLGAVSDDQGLQTTGQPTALRPIGVAPMRPEGAPMKPPMRLQPTHESPPLVATPFEERAGWIPGVEEDVGRATAQAVARIAEHLQCQLRLRGSTGAPEP